MRPSRRLVVLLLLVAGVVVAAEYAAAPRAKERLVAEVERATGLAPSVGSVSLSLWRGSATARGVVLPNPQPFQEPTLLEARALTVNLALLPLVAAGRVVVQRVALRDAKITVERDGQGATNIEALGERLKLMRPRHIRVDKLTLADSTVRLIDRSTGNPPARLVLEDLRAVVRDIDSARADDPLYTSFTVEAAVATPRRGRFAAGGRANPFSPSVNFDLDLTLENLDLPVLQRLYPSSPVVFLEGLADLYTRADCRSDYLEAQNRLVLRRLDFRTRGEAAQVAGLPLKTVLAFLHRRDRIELEFDVTGDVRNPKAHLEPAVERFVARALRDAILGTSGELVHAGKTGVSAGSRAATVGKKAGEAVVDGARWITSGLKRLLDW